MITSVTSAHTPHKHTRNLGLFAEAVDWFVTLFSHRLFVVGRRIIKFRLSSFSTDGVITPA
jgi:hypothetical protein